MKRLISQMHCKAYIHMHYVDLLYKNIYEPWFSKFVHETLPEVFAMCTHVQIKSRELFESASEKVALDMFHRP